MPIATRRTMGDVLNEQNSIAASRARKDKKLAEEQSLERAKLATQNRSIDVDAGIRNRLANIQSRQVDLEGRRVGELEKTGDVERGLATRQEDRLGGEQSFTQGLRNRRLALDVAKTFEGGEAADKLILGDTDFGITGGLTPRTTPVSRNLQYIKPTFDEDGKPLTSAQIFDPTEGRIGSPDSFARPTLSPVEAAKARVNVQRGEFESAMKSPYGEVEGDVNDLFKTRQKLSKPKEVPKITPSGKKKFVQTGKGRASDKHIESKESQAERRDKSILARLSKKKKAGRISATELDQFDKLHKKYVR